MEVEGQAPIAIASLVSDDVLLSPSDNGNGTLSYTHILAEWRETFKVGDRG